MTRAPVRVARAALSGMFFLLFGLFGLLFALLVVPFARSRGTVRRMVRLAFRAFVGLGRLTGLFTVSVAGDARGVRGRVVVMNHLSLIDVVVLLAALPDSTCVIKGALRRNPFMRAVVNAVFLVNDEDAERTIAEGCALLREGVNVIVFPEGTRLPPDATGRRLRRGAARLALAAGAAVQPVRLALAPTVLAKGQPWWDVGDRIIRYSLEFLDPIPSEGPSDHRRAVALTESVRFAIWGERTNLV